MKILWVGPYLADVSVVGPLQVKALRRLGHEVLPFDERASYIWPLHWMPRRLARSLRGRLPALSQRNVEAMNRTLIQSARQLRPEIVIVSKGLAVQLETISNLNAIGCVTANWFPDDLQRLDWVRQAAALYRHFFIFDSYTVDLLRGEGLDNVHYLPLACDPDVHRTMELTPAEHQHFDCDVCFIGAQYPERVTALLKLADLDLDIWGYTEWASTPLRAHYRGPIDNREGLVRAYNACRVAVNIHWKSAARGANYRTFEIAGSGACQIADARADIPHLFEPGREIVLYDSPDDLADEVRYYLKHTEERLAIARAGQARAHREHTFMHRFRRLLDTCLGKST